MGFRHLTYFCASVAAFITAVPNLCGEAGAFPAGARSAALGGAAVVATDVFAIYNNQAALGFVDRNVAAMNYQNRYLMPDLHLAAAVFAMPVPYAGTSGISVCSYGAAHYNELRAGLSMGRRLGDYFAVGAQVNYTRIAVSGYGNTGAITAEAGILAHPLDNLWLGAHAYNFTYSKFLSAYYDEPLPVIFNMGAGYDIVDNVSAFLQCEFYSGKNMRIKSGIEYLPLPALALRAGATLKPVELFAGAGYSLQGLTIDFALARHETLGYSPQVSLIYGFGK